MPIIVYVDEDADDNYAFFKQAIHTLSNHVILHYSACEDECFEMLETISPQFIFLGLGMPAEPALSFLHRVTALPRLRNIPIIIYSSYPAYVDETYAAGATYFIQKQESYAETVRILNHLLAPGAALPKHTSRESFYIH